jgi:uncharacterized protein YndB with AHSA1/START domain
MEVSKSITIPADPSTVFAAISKGDLFKATDIVKDTLQLSFQENGAYSFSWPEAGKCQGIFQKIDPNKRVLFTWVKSEAAYSKDPMETLVEVCLERINNGTELTLTHTGFKIIEAYNSHDEGWSFVLKEFAKTLA